MPLYLTIEPMALEPLPSRGQASAQLSAPVSPPSFTDLHWFWHYRYAHASLSVSELSAAGDVTAGGNIATGGAGKVTTNQVLAQSIGVGTTDPKSAVHISGYNGMIRLTGRSEDYINAGVVLEATNSNGARGLGVFMHDKGGKTEW